MPVSTASAILEVSNAGPSSSTDDVFEDEMMTIVESLVAIRRTRPRTTSVVIHDPEEEPRRTLAELERVQKERAVQEEASQTTINKELDDIQAMIEADGQMAVRLQSEEQEKYTIEEKARMLA
ncbi:hypothetical protein Tco_1180321 [Tanacetum coccineum]